MSSVYFFVMILLNCVAISSHGDIPQTKEEQAETTIISKIKSLYEVHTFFRIANKKELPDVIIDSTPTPENGFYYRVKVGYSKGMFRSVMIFEVSTKKLVVYYEDWGDIDAPKNISLSTWRRCQRDPRFFNKLHTFNKNGQMIVIGDKHGKKKNS